MIEFLKIHEQIKATATNIEAHEIKVLNEKQRNLDERFQQIKKKLNAANIA
jgi:chaperonin cofactor prefoldin